MRKTFRTVVGRTNCVPTHHPVAEKHYEQSLKAAMDHFFPEITAVLNPAFVSSIKSVFEDELGRAVPGMRQALDNCLN